MTFTGFAYIVASLLFAVGLKMMGSPATARRGNQLSAVGMLLAIAFTLWRAGLDFRWIAIAIAIGSVIGVVTALKVRMTAMPEMVAFFNGSGGLASMLLGWAELTASPGGLASAAAIAAVLAIVIGGITFSGSIVAWGKLSGIFHTGPIMYFGQQVVNALLLLAIVAGSAVVAIDPIDGLGPLSASAAIGIVIAGGLLLGVLSVIPIGGADMPVVISLLNSYSGLAASAAGFAIGNGILIVAGALVGASGIILTIIMCKAMNRSLANVLFSGFGSAEGKTGDDRQEGKTQALSVNDAYYVLEAAQSVVFVPGYGMAVAQAQHAVRELADILEENGTDVQFAIHPVAGRMPGHMNVLLAEANVSYDKLIDMDDINSRMDTVDVCIVIGANDVVNPAAREDKKSPIYGMPIIDAHRAKAVFVLKRSMASGFAGIENPLFYRDNTRMIFGDAKATIEGMIEQFKT